VRFVLPGIMLFLSLMMVSEVKYPTFKKLDLRATRTFTKTLIGILFIGAVLILQEKILVFALPLFFTAYLLYGFIRPRISKKVVEEIEDEEDDEHSPPA
jgi:CDP-diacylglycerol--serine O-phosphatidyltransferase